MSDAPFGGRLREWRRLRGMSQLALACEASTTPRYVSYLEAGRSRPSEAMVLRLSQALDLPLRERNRLLEAAGLAPAYRSVEPGAPDLAPYEAAVSRVLASHEPYPALVLDRHWNVTATNRGCERLFGAELVGTNLVRRYFGDPRAADAIVNWADVAWAGLTRLRDQVEASPFDDELRALLAVAEAAIGEIESPAPAADGLVVCPHFRVGDDVIRTVGMVMRFDTAVELTLDGLRVELTYPADETAHRFFLGG